MLLKKHLEENPDTSDRYIELKNRFAYSGILRNEYCMGKTSLIIEFLKVEGISELEINRIQKENL